MDKITIERETLLPCPFCGGEPEADPSYQAGTYYGCHECGVWMMGAAKWNRRAALAQKAEPTEGAIVVSKNEAGQIVCVSRQDEDGRFLSIIAESADAPPAPAAVPLTKEQRELFDLILHHYGPDKRLQPLRDLIAAAGDKS